MRLLNSLSSDGFEVSYVPHPNAKNIWSIISAGTKIRNTLRGLSACKKQESSTSKGICEFEFADFESDAHIGSTLINLGLV